MHHENASASNSYPVEKVTAALSDMLQRLESRFRHVEEQISDASNIVAEGRTLLKRMANVDSCEPTDLESKNDASQNSLSRGTVVYGEGSRKPANSAVLGAVEDEMVDDSTLRIYTFGRFRMRCAGQTVDDWHNNRAKSILKLLLIHGGGPVPKDVFIESLWPSTSLRSASSSFRVAVHELRRTFSLLVGDAAKEFVFYDGANYYLTKNANVWIDCVEFERLFGIASDLDRAGRYKDSVQIYMEAEKIYRGDFLEEDLYEDWPLVKREGLLDFYLAILAKLSEYYFGIEDYESCIEYCQKVLAKDVCREDTYQRLIVCHARLGQPSRALRWYEVCKTTLLKELNCDVSPKTETLYKSVANRSRV